MDDSPRAEQPGHFRSLHLRNFRGFKRAESIPLRPLTFLVGQNSAGKSTLFDALMLITQSGFGPYGFSGQIPNWGGPLVDLGSYKDAVHGHNEKLRIGIGVTTPIGLLRLPWDRPRKRLDLSSVRIDFNLHAPKRDQIGRLADVKITDERTDAALRLLYKRNPIAEIMNKRFEWVYKRGMDPNEFDDWIAKQIASASNGDSRSSGWRRVRRFVQEYGMAFLMQGS